MTQYRELQKQVKRDLRLAKLKYKDKVECMLNTCNSHHAWQGVKSMMGVKPKKNEIS